MSELVTRGELHEALETWSGAIIERILAGLEDQFKRIEERFERTATKEDLARTNEDLARHAKAIMEASAAQIAMLDDKYGDLPPRVDRLEATVYKRTRRAKPKPTPSRSPVRRRR